MADKVIILDHHGRPLFVGREDPPRPLSEPITSHGETVELVPLESTDILNGSQFAEFQPDFCGTAMIWFGVNTPGVSGVLSLNVYTIGGAQVNTTAWLIDGMTIGGAWKPIPIPIGRKYVYALSFSTACNVTVHVLGEPRLITPGMSNVQVVGTADVALSGSIAVEAGTASAAGTTGTLTDSTKSWEVNMWANSVVSYVVSGVEYSSVIASNTVDVLTFATMAVAPASGSTYQIKVLAGSGGGGGAITVAAGAIAAGAAVDGSNVTEGFKGDAAASGPTVSATKMSVLKGIWTTLLAGIGITGTVTNNDGGTLPTGVSQATGGIGLTGLLGAIKGWLDGTLSSFAPKVTALISGSKTGQGANVDQDNNLEVTAANAIWVHDYTVPAGEVGYISSGNELAVGNLTVNGTLINYGVIRCQSCSFGVSGAYVAGVGSTFEVNSIF